MSDELKPLDSAWDIPGYASLLDAIAGSFIDEVLDQIAAFLAAHVFRTIGDLPEAVKAQADGRLPLEPPA